MDRCANSHAEEAEPSSGLPCCSVLRQSKFSAETFQNGSQSRLLASHIPDTRPNAIEMQSLREYNTTWEHGGADDGFSVFGQEPIRTLCIQS